MSIGRTERTESARLFGWLAFMVGFLDGHYLLLRTIFALVLAGSATGLAVVMVAQSTPSSLRRLWKAGLIGLLLGLALGWAR